MTQAVRRQGICGTILTVDKIFQFPHGTCCRIGQHAPCGKENLIDHKYKIVQLRIVKRFSQKFLLNGKGAKAHEGNFAL